MKNKKLSTKKDYLLASLIALLLSFFLIPTLKNILGESFKLSYVPYFSLIVLIITNICYYLSNLIATKIPAFLQVAKFVLVGGFNTFADWGVVNLLMTITLITSGVWFSVFNIFSFIIANIFSFFWNKYWIFSSGKEKAVKDYAQFFVVSLGGLIIKVGIATLVANNMPESIANSKLWANFALLSATVFSMVWNFIGYKFVVFKK
ncbi:MAG: GtrA family protein [Candidatus Moranbacteria bacterium]|nr:GtrA family protein [Candidatus Moranbacteria bacterium]